MNLSLTDISKKAILLSALFWETEIEGSFLQNAEAAVSRMPHFAIPVAQLLHFLHMMGCTAKDGQLWQLPGCQAQDITRHYFSILGPTHTFLTTEGTKG